MERDLLFELRFQRVYTLDELWSMSLLIEAALAQGNWQDNVKNIGEREVFEMRRVHQHAAALEGHLAP